MKQSRLTVTPGPQTLLMVVGQFDCWPLKSGPQSFSAVHNLSVYIVGFFILVSTEFCFSKGFSWTELSHVLGNLKIE